MVSRLRSSAREKSSCRQIWGLLLVVILVIPAFAEGHSLDLSTIRRGLDKATLLKSGHAVANSAVTGMNSLNLFRRLDEVLAERERALARASGVGAFFSSAIKEVRGGSDEFYQHLVTAAKIVLCDHGLNKNSARFVNSSADNAYKNDDGDCVRLPISPLTSEDVVTAYSKGQCEVMPNCYWAPIKEEDVVRARVYADPDSPMNKEKAVATVKNWLIGVLGFVIPGVVLGILSVLTMVFFLVCRCCCNRCGGRYPRKAGYTRSQKCLSLLFFLLFAVAVFVVSLSALLYRDSILGSVDEIFNATSGLLENGTAWVVSIRDPLENVRDKVNSSVDLVITELKGSDFIEAGVYSLIGKFRAFGAYAANRTLPDGCSVDSDQSSQKYVGSNGNICLPCDVCTTISAEIDSTSDEVEAKAEPGVEQLITVRSQLNQKLVNVVDSVRKAVNSKVLVANDLLATLGLTHDKVDDYDDTFQTYRVQLGVEIMKLFYFAGGIIMLGTAGIFFSLTPLKWLVNLMHVAYLLGFIVLFVVFVVSSVVVALGVVLGDACEITLIFSADWTVLLGDSARAVDACFQNESLLDVFNLSSQLSFARGGITFPTINVDAMLDFSALDAFSETISTTKESTFAFSEAHFGEIVSFVNAYATQNELHCHLNDEYTKENVVQPWVDNGDVSSATPLEYIIARYEAYNDACPGLPDLDYGKPFACANHPNPCEFSEFMGEQFSVLVNIAEIKSSVYVFVDQLQQNVTQVFEFTHEFKRNITGLLGRIETIKDNLENSLIKYVGDFERAMYCTFIADGFFDLYDAVCAHMAPSITMIGLMLLAVGLFLIPVNICLIIGVKRLKARRFGPVAADAGLAKKIILTKPE